MRRKSIIVFAFTICLCISYLAGCKSNVETKTSSKENQTADVSAAPSGCAAESASKWKVVNTTSFTHKANTIAFRNLDNGFSVGYSGEIHYTTDQGKTWPRAENSSACLFGVEIINENTAFACGNKANVTKTTDGGKTWKRVTDFGNTAPYQCRMLSFVDENTGFIASDYKLAYTSDSGKTWTEKKPPAKIYAIYLTTATKGYLIGRDGKLYVTNDSGATWEAKDLNVEGFNTCLPAAKACALSIHEDGTGILFYLSPGGVLKYFETKDDCATWTQSAELNLLDSIKSSLFLYLTRDEKYLTVQNADGNAAAILTCAE